MISNPCLHKGCRNLRVSPPQPAQVPDVSVARAVPRGHAGRKSNELVREDLVTALDSDEHVKVGQDIVIAGNLANLPRVTRRVVDVDPYSEFL